MAKPFSTETSMSGPLFERGLFQRVLDGMFKDAIKEAVEQGAELVRQRAPVDEGDFRDSIVGEVRTSRRGRRYGHVRSKGVSADGLRPRRPGRRLFLERGTRNGVKVTSGHKMFLRGKQALRKRERAIAQEHAGRAVRRFR